MKKLAPALLLLPLLLLPLLAKQIGGGYVSSVTVAWTPSPDCNVFTVEWWNGSVTNYVTTTNTFVVIAGLQSGHAYGIAVKEASSKTELESPYCTPLFYMPPWRKGQTGTAQ